MTLSLPQFKDHDWTVPDDNLLFVAEKGIGISLVGMSIASVPVVAACTGEAASTALSVGTPALLNPP